MGLKLLGPPELAAGDRSHDIGPPRVRVVLSMLALNANRVTPVDQLIDAVWSSTPPVTARSQIQICVSTLRKLFQDTGQPIAIRTRPPGYLLDVAADDLDLEQFTRRVTAARAEADAGQLADAAGTLRTALALWRGPALAGVPSEIVQRGAAQLDERRLAVVEDRIRLDLALGRHQELIGELRTLAGEQPLRERLHGLLMLALYRSGRQAEALAAYRTARTTLVDEIGIEPSQELQNLERAILNRHPSLDLSPPDTTPTGPTAKGTDSARAGATAAGPDPGPAGPTTPVVDGTSADSRSAGVGPTGMSPAGDPTTANAAAGATEATRANGPTGMSPAGDPTTATGATEAIADVVGVDEVDLAVVPRQLPASIADFTGRGEQIAAITQLLGDSGPAHAPYAMRVVTVSGSGGVGKSCLAIRVAHELSDAFPDGHLYADLRTAGGERSTARVLARFLRALGVAGSGLPDGLQERAEMYRSRLAGKRILVVLDGVSGEDQVLPLLPGSPSCAVIATSRTRLGGLSGAHGVDVGVFDIRQSLELLAKIIGPARVEAEEDSAVELVRFCDGLPLALRIAGARLASRPHWRIAGLVERLADEARRLDELTHHGLELRSNIELTYRSLDPRAQRLFRLYAMLQAPDFPAWTAAALLDTDTAEAEDVLESLVDAQLLTTVDYPDARVPRYRFHDLIRVYAAEQLAQTEDEDDKLAALARALGGWMALAEEAHRRIYGGDYTILHGSAERWRPPGGGTGAELTGDPVEWLESERRALVAAVRQAAAAGLDELCWDLAFNLITLCELKGYFDDWRDTSQLGFEVTKRAGNRFGQAAMLHSLGTMSLFQKRLGDATRYLSEAVEQFRELDHPYGAALATRSLGLVDDLHEDYPAMLEKYAESLAFFRTAGDRDAEAQVLRGLAKYEIYNGDPTRGHELLTEALDIVREVRSMRGEAQILYRFGELYTRTGEFERARQTLYESLRLVRDIDDRIGEAYTLYGIGVTDHQDGRLDDAGANLRRALAVAELVGERLIEAKANLELGEIVRIGGDHTAALAHLDRAARLFHDLGARLRQATALIQIAEIHVTTNHPARATTAADRADTLLTAVQTDESTQLRTRLDKVRANLPRD